MMVIEFTDHQRHVFCVFSGDGVNKLRDYLNNHSASLYDHPFAVPGDFPEDGDVPNGLGPDLGVVGAGVPTAADFAAVIAGDATPICSGRDGLKTLKVVDAVVEAARTGQSVRIAT